MTTKQFADLLDGRQYGDEISKETAAMGAKHGLVAVFGYSDDGLEFRGAIHQELGCWIGTERQSRSFHFDKDGHFPDLEEKVNDGDIIDMSKYASVTATWCPEGQDGEIESSWRVESCLPFSTFRIREEGELFCIGCVIDLKDMQHLGNESLEACRTELSNLIRGLTRMNNKGQLDNGMKQRLERAKKYFKDFPTAFYSPQIKRSISIP